MSDINEALNLEYIRTVHQEALSELDSEVSAHVSKGESVYTDSESKHSTRWNSLESKVVSVDG